MNIGQIVEIDTDNGPVEATITRLWNKPATDPYVTVKTTEDYLPALAGQTFVRCASRIRVLTMEA